MNGRNVNVSKWKKQNINRWISHMEIESVIKSLPIIRGPGTDGFTGDLHQTCKEVFFLKSSKMKRREHFQIHFMRSALS